MRQSLDHAAQAADVAAGVAPVCALAGVFAELRAQSTSAAGSFVLGRLDSLGARIKLQAMPLFARVCDSSPSNVACPVIHWRSSKDADALMASFAFTSAAQGFMAKIDASSLAMKRYSQP